MCPRIPRKETTQHTLIQPGARGCRSENTDPKPTPCSMQVASLDAHNIFSQGNKVTLLM